MTTTRGASSVWVRKMEKRGKTTRISQMPPLIRRSKGGCEQGPLRTSFWLLVGLLLEPAADAGSR